MGQGISRRKFVVGTASLAAIGAVAACGGSENGADSGEAHVEAGTKLAALDEIPEGESELITTEDGTEIIITRTSASAAKAFSAICTHKGCTVMAGSTPLMCPCHGSTFDPKTGENIGGPAPRPLPEIAIEVVDGEIRAV